MKKNFVPYIIGGIIVFCIFVGVIASTDTSTQSPQNAQQAQISPEYNVNISSLEVLNTFKDGVLSKGYSIKGNIYQTKSKDFENVYIFGALVSDNQGQIYNCLWANNDSKATGMFDSINEYAQKVSGIFTSGNVKNTDDGYSRINQKLLSDWDNLNKPISINPSQACDYLSNVNLSTQGYKDDGMGGYFCTSQYKMLDTKSNITYTVEGNATQAQKLYLNLNVYNDSNAQSLLSELVSNSKLLAKTALDCELSNKVVNALKQGKNATEQYKDYTIEVYKDVWSTNKGYNIQFIIKK